MSSPTDTVSLMHAELVSSVSGSDAKGAEPISLAAPGLREREHLQRGEFPHPEILGGGVRVIPSAFDRWASRAGLARRRRPTKSIHEWNLSGGRVLYRI
jgi:hypothetical protein